MTPKERAVNLTAAEVRAALAGTLTEIRRMSDCPPEYYAPFGQPAFRGASLVPGYEAIGVSAVLGMLGVISDNPFGCVGDLVYGNESWKTCHGSYVPGIRFLDGAEVFPEFENEGLQEMPSDWADFEVERLPLHLPRWASRITLEVTAVRVEQVESIWTWIASVRRVPAQQEGAK